jgi:hypothetical protein
MLVSGQLGWRMQRFQALTLNQDRGEGRNGMVAAARQAVYNAGDLTLNQ